MLRAGMCFALVGTTKRAMGAGRVRPQRRVIPDPGVTYANVAINYSASRLNDSNGNRILQNVTGTYSFWVDENIFFYVPHHKFLGGYFMPFVAVNYATGSLVAEQIPSIHWHQSQWQRGRIRSCRYLRPASVFGLALQAS